MTSYQILKSLVEAVDSCHVTMTCPWPNMDADKRERYQLPTRADATALVDAYTAYVISDHGDVSLGTTEDVTTLLDARAAVLGLMAMPTFRLSKDPLRVAVDELTIQAAKHIVLALTAEGPVSARTMPSGPLDDDEEAVMHAIQNGRRAVPPGPLGDDDELPA